MVRIGILGAGNIARRFAASLAHEERAELVAASCRSTEKAAAFLDEVPHAESARAYGSHDELLADADVDAIYLALPHDLHKQWALRALRAGKAVLCEKPAMLTADEMREVAAVARETGLLFVEAMKPRFVPLYAPVMEAIGQIGSIQHVDATLCNDMLAQVEANGSYHMTPGPGAGVLLDCGAYCANWIARLCPGELELLTVDTRMKQGIEIYVNAQLLAGGVEASLECAFDEQKVRRCMVVGEHGSVEIIDLHRPEKAIVSLEGRESREICIPYEIDDFYGEIRHFVDLLEVGKSESPLMTLDDSIACARVLDIVRAGVQ